MVHSVSGWRGCHFLDVVCLAGLTFRVKTSPTLLTRSLCLTLPPHASVSVITTSPLSRSADVTVPCITHRCSIAMCSGKCLWEYKPHTWRELCKSIPVAFGIERIAVKGWDRVGIGQYGATRFSDRGHVLWHIEVAANFFILKKGGQSSFTYFARLDGPTACAKNY